MLCHLLTVYIIIDRKNVSTKKVSRLFINRLTKLDFMLFYAEILAYILEHKNFDGFHGGSFFERHCNVDFIH